MYEGQFETFPDESNDESKLLSRQKRCVVVDAVACTCLVPVIAGLVTYACPGGCPCSGTGTSHTTNKDYPVITTVSLYLWWGC